MSGNPNWNPPLQTSSVRFPRKAVETPQIPPNSTARPRPGAPFQPVYPNPITQIPTITATADPSNPRPVYNQLYTLSTGKGEVITYPGRRGVPVPTVITVKTAERYLVFGVNFPYPMSGTDHFIFTFTSLNTGEQTVKNFQPAPQYIVGGLLPGVLYTLTVAPVVNGITYQGSAPPLGPLTISAVSEKNVQLQGVTLSGGDKSAVISWLNATPQPPLAFEVTTVAVDDNFGSPQRRLTVIPTYIGQNPINYSGYVPITNLNNGSAYTFTITPYHDTDGIYEYGRPTTLPPFIPGPPGDLVITRTSADGSLNTVTLNVTYDTTIHPVPESTKISVYNSTFTTLCSLVGQPTTVVQDNSQTYASFTTSTGLFGAQGFASIAAAVANLPGSIQVDLLNDKGYWYTFPLTDVSTGGLGYTFENSNFVKTTNLISTASSYSVLFRTVSLGTLATQYTSSSALTSLTIPTLGHGLYTLIGSNFANGLYSLSSTYTSIAGGPPDSPRSIVALTGNQFLTLSFSGYNPADGTYPRPSSYLYTITNGGTTYTSINSNITIGGLVNGSAYTFRIQGFGNATYGPSSEQIITPGLAPPTNVFVSAISNYDVTISFTPAIGGADYYQITNQSGQAVGLSGGLYKFQNLSADIPYIFRGQSFAYGSPVYTLSSTNLATTISEIPSTYAQFLVSPSVATLSYASTMIANIQYFVPYNYTISGGGTSYSFPITSMTPVYDGSGNLQWYNLANTTISKAVSTFSGATTYATTLSTTVALFQGMVPTTYSGTISSAFSLPTSPSAYVGPPTGFFVSTSLASSQRVDISIQVASLVVPSRYYYTEITGKNVSGYSDSTHIVIDNLSSGLSYTFSISAFGNQVYGLTGISAGPYVLSTAAPSNGVATFSNTTATVTFSGYSGTGITYNVIMYENGYPGRIITFLGGQSTSYTFNPTWANAGIKYGFTVQGADQGIPPNFSVLEIIDPIIAGTPATPCNIVTTLSSDSITFNWSSGNTVYNETYRITEYLSNNGVRNPTGVVVSGLTSRTYTISSVITTSANQVFGYTGWLEQSPGYASFVLLNTPFTSFVGGVYASNQVWLTLQQSGLTYSFPLSTVTTYNSTSNIYANANYSKDPGDIFNPLLSISVTYSYGTGPRNGGTYSYAFTSYANQVYSAPSNVGVNMFVLPVSGVPTVSVVGTTATVSFSQTNPAGTVYRVTNNYGATVSRAPYTFANLSTGIPYTFSVVASNGVFVSVSSELTPQVYVGPPPIPLVGASYFGQIATVTATDTTISSTVVFYDTGTQGTGQTITTPSHTNVIQTSSGGFWVPVNISGYGPLKDTNTGFFRTTTSGYAVYSNDGYSNALYQFTVTPSTGTITATLSAYSLIITGSTLAVTNAGVQVYSGTTLSATYPVQFISYSNGFGIQSGAGGGNNLLYYSQVPAGSDSLEMNLMDTASFSNFQAARIQAVGPATVSYGIVDQFGIMYSPSLQVATYTPSGLQYTYNIFNIPYAITLRFGVTPYANSVAGPPAFVDIYLFTGAPGTPQVSIYNTTATITVPKVAIGSVDTYFLEISGGGIISTLSAVSTASAAYIFNYPGLTAHQNYYFSAYAKYLGVPTTTGKVTVGPYEAGTPYVFPGLVPGSAIIGTPNTTKGTYTLSASVDPGLNSNAAIITSVYSGTTFVTSQSINASKEQVFSFTVSSGAIYTLSATAYMNGFTANATNPSISVSANPFPPQAVAITISSTDYGTTYRGVITTTSSSATPNITYLYGYVKDGTSNDLASVRTFNVLYNSSYTGYAYANSLGGTLSSSITSSSPVCNVFISPPTNVQVDYKSVNISLTWTGATDGLTNYYTVIASNRTTNTITISQNISYSGLPPTQQYAFTGIEQNAYTFSVVGQSTINPNESVIYSASAIVSVSLTTQSVSATIGYIGTAITVSFSIANITTLSSSYTFGVMCICGTVLNNTNYPNTTGYRTNGYQFDASGFGQTLIFSVQPLLKGIFGVSSQTAAISLTASAMTNVSQSYNGNQYMISWLPNPTPGYSYTLQEVSGKVSTITTQLSLLSFTLSYGLSYHFQTYATYNGVTSTITDLSTIYTYTNPISGSPTTDYTGTTISVSWSAATQADGNPATSYILRNICASPVTEVTFVGVTASSFVGSAGSTYQYTVTALYNGISSSASSPGDQIGLYTYAPTNVNVTNSGQNLLVSWSGSTWPPSTQGTIFYTLSQIGNGTLIGTGKVTTSSSLYSPIQTLSIDQYKYYNYVITASAKGIASTTSATASVSGQIFTYPPTNVVLTYMGIDTPSLHDLSHDTINPIITWQIPPSSSQFSSIYTVSLLNVTNPTNNGGIEKAIVTAPGSTQATNPSTGTTLNLQLQYNNSIQPYVYATNNGLNSETISGSPVRVYTASPGVIGTGFDGLYQITFNLCRGDTNAVPEYYTIWERSNAYQNNTRGYLYPGSYFTVPYAGDNTIYQIPLTGTQGYTYDFAVYATLCGVVSTLNTTLSAYKLETTAVTNTSMSVSYSGTIITFSWSEAMQQSYTGNRTPPNGGYTIYVTPGNPYVPLISLYTDTCYRFAGVAGQTYFFTIEAVNNNITSSPTQSPYLTLYQPVVTNLAATNSSTNGVDVSMILTWTPDILSASGATYYAVAYNQTTGRTVTSTTSANANTVTFTGSIGVTYTFYVEGIYNGISGLAQSVQMTNAQPVITSFSLTNLGNNIFAQYTVTPVGSPVTLSAYNTSTSSVVTSICYTSATTATLSVSSSTGGYVYSISATATCNGIPSTVCGATYTMKQPTKPTPVGTVYNNTLVSVSWGTSTNASSYTFVAYDLCTNQQANIQTYIPQTFTTFNASLGHVYSLSVTAYSYTYIPSVTADTSVAIVIPDPPKDLSLNNAGSLVTVTWTACSAVYSNYSFTVVNAASPGTIFYQSFFASPSDTFLATVGQTFRVNLYGTSLCNVTSTSSAVSSLLVYQPSIESVTATGLGTDITLTFPPDPDKTKTCEFLVTNNFGYKTLLYSPSKQLADISASYNSSITTSYAQYTQPTNGYISYTVANCSYILTGYSYLFTVVPYYKVVAGPSVKTPTVNPITLYKPSTPGQFTVTNQGSDLLLNWQSSAIDTAPVPTLVPNYKVEVSQVIPAFSPTTICGLQLWLDGSDPSGSGVKPADGYVVTTWKDKSGKAQDGSASGTQRATYSLSSNGLVFTGSQAYSTTISSSISSQTGFAVVSYNTISKLNIISVTRTSGSGSPGIQQLINNNVLQLQPYGGSASVSGGTVTQNTPFIYDYTFSTISGSSIYANGTNTATSSTTTTFTGSGTINIGEAFSGTIFEVMLYDSVLTLVQRQQAEGYLARKWGLVQKLPDTHPYGPWPNAISPKYITGTSTTFGGYNSDAGQLSISVTAIIPGYDQNLSGTNYIYGFTANRSFTIPNQTSISIRQTDYNNPQNLSVTIPPMAAAYIWFQTTAIGVTSPVRYTVVSNNDNTQSIFQTCNVTVSTGLYYTISAYGWVDGTTFPGPASAIAIANANPNPYPATTFNVSYASIKTSHSGTTVTVSWAAVPQASYYQVQEYILPTGVKVGGIDLVTATSWQSTATHTAGSTYNFEITAYTVSDAKFDGVRTILPSNIANNCNAYFPDQLSSNEILYIPGSVVNLTAVQFLQTVSLTWLQPSSWTPNASITTTSANTTYFIQQLSGTTSTIITSKTISGEGTLQTSFNISAGSTYTFTVSTAYYGIPATTVSTVSLATVNPSITALTLTDNGNKTLTLAGTANTAGDWYANISTGSTAVYPATPLPTNTTSFTLNQDVTAGSAWTGFVKFIATLGGLTVSSQTAQLTLPNPTITTCSISDNFTDGTLTLNLVASIGGSGSYTPRWTVPATVNGTGTGQPLLSLFTSPANSASTTAVYKKALAAQTYSFTGITVSADGFQSTTLSASYTTPAFTVSQNPAQIIITNPKTLSATFFSPELTNVGPPRTLSTSLTLSSTISWNFPTSLTNGGTLVSYAPLTGSGIVDVSYSNVTVGTTVSFPANSVSINYLGYTVSLGSAVSYATPNPTVTVGTAATRFVDNHDGTLTLFLVAAGCTQGSGNVTWTVPSSVSGNGTAPDALTVSGSATTLSSTSVLYTGAKHGSTYTITQGNVSVAYSGYSSSNATSIASEKVALPQLTAITGVYFGCSEDKAITGTDSITVSISSDLASSWTITACSALTLNSSSGQGTTAVQWAFSGGLKTKAYTFTVGTCNVTVSLTKPTANVTPSFSSFSLGSSTKTVITAFSPAPSSASPVFVFLGTSTVTATTTTQTLTITGFTNDTIFTVSAAVISNGILGNISSYQFAAPSSVTSLACGSSSGSTDQKLATSNTIFLGWTDSGTTGGFVYNVYSNTSAPGTGVVTGAQTTKENSSGLTTNSFQLTLGSGSNIIWVGKSITLNGVTYNSDFASHYSFIYASSNFINCNANTGGVLQSATMPTGFSVISADIVGGGGGGGAYWDTGRDTDGGIYGIGGTGAWLQLKNFSVGSGETLYYYVGGGGSAGATGTTLYGAYDYNQDSRYGGGGGDWSFLFTSRDNGPYYAGGGGGGSSENRKGTVDGGRTGTSGGNYPAASAAGTPGPKVGGGWITDLTLAEYLSSVYYNNPAYVAVGYNYFAFLTGQLPGNYHIYYAVAGPSVPTSGNIGGGAGGHTGAQYGDGGITGRGDGGGTTVGLTTANSGGKYGNKGGTNAANNYAWEPSVYNNSTTGPGAGGYNGTQDRVNVNQDAGMGGTGVDGLVSVTAFKCTVTIT